MVGGTKKACSDADWVTIAVDDDVESSEEDRGVLEVVRQNITVAEVVADILPPTNLLNDTSIDLFQTIVREY